MQFIKDLIPEFLLKFIRPYYHGLLALFADLYFGKPSSQMVMVGITGTAGKSTTVQMLARILSNSGRKVGFITTVSFFDGKTEQVNKHGLSMPGGWMLQKQLGQILNNGCQYAVIECTSEGLEQNRHLGIKFDVAVLTNLSSAHLETHGGFENYKKAKAKLFESLTKYQITNTKLQINPNLKKTIIANSDDVNSEYFLNFAADRKVKVGFKDSNIVKETDKGFEIEGVNFEVKLPGEFNHYNALLAVSVARELGVGLEACAKAIATFTKIRGRMELVENNKGILVFVDYGCEPASIKAALMAVNEMEHNRIIHIFGTTGGHRDVNKRFIFGQESARLSDISILTNDDVYESDPLEIIKNMRQGYESVPKVERKSKEIYEVPDRREAIKYALSIATQGDIVLITGKGSEQFLVLPGNQRVEWDEVAVVKQELKNNDKN